VLANCPGTAWSVFARIVIFPLGLPYHAPSDLLGSEVAHTLQTAGDSRTRLLAGSYVHHDANDAIACIEQAFGLWPEVEAIEKRLKATIHDHGLDPLPQNLGAMDEWATAAAIKGMITPQEQGTLRDFARLAARAVHVDDFAQDFDADSYRRIEKTAEDSRHGEPPHRFARVM
jgi:acyl-CoA dehydrogenase